LDLFSRFIVEWAVSAVNDRHLTIKALEMALKCRCPEVGLLLYHSGITPGPGRTFASEEYQGLLVARGIVCSMSEGLLAASVNVGSHPERAANLPAPPGTRR